MATDPVVLREQFACAVLGAMGWNPTVSEGRAREIARTCWRMADIMIEEMTPPITQIASMDDGKTYSVSDRRQNIPFPSGDENEPAFQIQYAPSRSLLSVGWDLPNTY